MIKKLLGKRFTRRSRQHSQAKVVAATPVELERRLLLAAITTDFESIDSSDFTIGSERHTAHFSGDAFAGTVGVQELYRSGHSAWIINSGGTGVISFDHPAVSVELYSRLSSTAATGNLQIRSFGLDGSENETVELSAPSADFQQITFTSPTMRIEFLNSTNEIVSVEDFQASTGILVDTVIDESDADTSAGDVSLREAIEAANAREESADTILFSPALFQNGRASIVLQEGQFSVTGALEIAGPGADLLTVDGNQQSRIFAVGHSVRFPPFPPPGVLSLSGVTLTGGNSADGSGGAIQSIDDLNLLNVVITGNSANTVGGGISVRGAVTISNSQISNNTSRHSGGGILHSSLNSDDTLVVYQSTISGNVSGSGAGGIRTSTGRLEVISSTISGNTAAEDGGGILVSSSDADQSRFKIHNSTIAGNRAVLGAGIFTDAPPVISSSTIAGNRSSSTGPYAGAGVYDQSRTGRAEIVNSIITGNQRTNGWIANFYGGHTSSNSIIGGSRAQFDDTWKSTLENDGSIPILKDNGGPTQTIAILPQSDAVDSGDIALLPTDLFDSDDDMDQDEAIPFDQTGASRVFDMPLIDNAGGGLDIGAVELQNPVRFFDDGNIALQANSPAGFMEDGIEVFHNGNQVGNGTFQVVEVFDQVENQSSYPLTFVDLVANTFARATYQNSDGSTGALGTTVVGSPSFRTADSVFHFAPTVLRADIATEGPDRYKSAIDAQFESIAQVRSTRTFPDPSIGLTSFGLDVEFTANQDISLATGEFASNDRFRVLTLSSMFESETQFDANFIRFEDKNGDIQVVPINSSTSTDSHLFAQPIEVGSYIELAKTSTSTWSPDSPTIRIEINEKDGLRLGLQGFLADSDDPNDDSLSVWLEWLDAPDTISGGRQFTTSFTATATPPETPEVVVNLTGDNTTVSESGDSDKFSIKLSSPPTADVTISIISQDETEGTASHSNLLFTTDNWSVAQEVTVQGVDDSLVDGDINFNLTITPASDDFHYNDLPAVTVEVVTIDDDELPGNIDGDADFDANDSFLIQLILLAGTDLQIDQSKGSSPLTAAEIRSGLTDLATQDGIDGDGDFDASDAFLIHLVQLGGSDLLIDQSKGPSPLTASQIRTNVRQLGQNGNGTTASNVAVNTPAGSTPRRELFKHTSVATSQLIASQYDDESNLDKVHSEYRSWIDVL